MTCSVAECDRPVKTRGFCNRHYQRWWNHGDVTVVLNNRGRPPLERFLMKVRITPTCWWWTGNTTRRGYGMFQPAGRGMPAHRWAYEHYVGPIPAGLEMDHLCRNRACVNPAHLEPVTSAENRRRSPVRPEHQTHCKRGHPYDEANTYLGPGRGGRLTRVCRACSNASRQRYVQRQRANRAARSG